MNKENQQIVNLRALRLTRLFYILIVSVLLLISISTRAQASLGICQSISAADSAAINYRGDNVEYCDTTTCATAISDQYVIDGYSYSAIDDFTIYGGAVNGVRLSKVVGSQTLWVTIIYDPLSTGEYIKEGCSPENTLMNDLLGWLMYIFTAVAYAWAFVTGIHTVNS